jgi:hypothetical protein
LEIGDWRLEIGDWRLEIGKWRRSRDEGEDDTEVVPPGAAGPMALPRGLTGWGDGE